jgi:hypothetical protein
MDGFLFCALCGADHNYVYVHQLHTRAPLRAIEAVLLAGGDGGVECGVPTLNEYSEG